MLKGPKVKRKMFTYDNHRDSGWVLLGHSGLFQ